MLYKHFKKERYFQALAGIQPSPLPRVGLPWDAAGCVAHFTFSCGCSESRTSAKRQRGDSARGSRGGATSLALAAHLAQQPGSGHSQLLGS